MLTMVKKIGSVHVGFYCIILFCLKKCHGSPNTTEKTVSKRQADSFIVSANYGVQSGNFNNQLQPNSPQNSSTTNHNVHTFDRLLQQSKENSEPLPTASAWRGSNDLQSFVTISPYLQAHESHLPNDPDLQDSSQLYYGGLSDFKSSQLNLNGVDSTYGTTSSPSTRRHHHHHHANAQQPLHERSDDFHTEYNLNNDIFSDIQKPSVHDLQQIISKLVKGATKVHQVVKVPAVYEIHLQEEEETVKPNIFDDPKHFQVPLTQWHSQTTHQRPADGRWQSTKFVGGAKKSKPHKHHKTSRHRTTKTWNIPSNIHQYFNSDTLQPVNGKYSYPKPFSANNKWELSGDTWAYPSNTDPLYYDSVSVPMTPGSTAVSLLSNPNVYGSSQNAAPDLSLYYAKKKELENQGYSASDKQGYRRNDKAAATAASRRGRYRKIRRSGGQPGQRMFSPFNGMNYIIHVREKPRK